MSDDSPRLLAAAVVRAAVADPSGGDAAGAVPAEPTVVGVLLAAGRSERFDAGNKLLADLDGEPVVRHAARTLRDADLARVVAVVGHDADAVRDALACLDLAAVENPDYRQGLSTSVRAGVDAAADAGADAAVFLPGDVSRVDPATVNLLVDAYRADLADAVAAAADGRRGNPVLFDARHFPALSAVEGDVGGRPVFLDADRNALVATGDSGVLRDVDTPGDLDEYR